MRDYSTLRALRNGETITIEGCEFVADNSPLEVGDWYIGERNQGPKLATVKRFAKWDYDQELKLVDAPSFDEADVVFPMEWNVYAYDATECVKVREV